MLNTPVVIIAIAAILGFLAALGVGGGSLLMLWLTAIVQMTHAEARVLNLLFFLPAAVISSFLRLRKGALPLKKLSAAILTGAVAAGLFSLLSYHVDTSLLKKLFGVLLLITGVRELFYRPKKAK